VRFENEHHHRTGTSIQLRKMTGEPPPPVKYAEDNGGCKKEGNTLLNFASRGETRESHATRVQGAPCVFIIGLTHKEGEVRKLQRSIRK